MSKPEGYDYIHKLLASDPELNLYLLAFENPNLEDAALCLAHELENEVRLRRTVLKTAKGE